MHPIRYVLATQLRLAVTAILASAALIPISLWLDWFIDTQSRSPGLNSLLVIGWLLLILGVSWVESYFVGDLLFPRGWRRHLMLSRGQQPRERGRPAAAADDEAEAEADDEDVVVPRRFRSYTLHFSAVLGLLVLGNCLLVSQLRSGALWRIADVQLETALRSDDPDVASRAVERVTRIGTRDALTHFTDRVIERMDDPDPAVARAAVAGLAHIARRMRVSMEELRRLRSPQGWEQDLYQRLQQTQAERLLLAFRHRAELRPAVATALGALEATDALQQFETFLWQDKPDRDTVRAIVVATGDLRELHGLPIPLEVLTWDDGELQAVAGWALGEILAHYDPEKFTREPGCIALTVDALATHLPKLLPAGRCALVEAFARFRDARAAGALFALFDAADDDDRCPRTEIPRRFGPPSVASTEEPLRFKVLVAIAAIAGGNDEVIGWLERRLRQADLSERYRRELESILERARQS